MPIWALILIAVILFSLAISSGVAKYSTTGTSILAAQDAPTPSATTIVIPVATFATEQPTPIPTPSPTPTPTPNQHRYLGSAVPVFQAIYGHNGDTSLNGS